MTRRVSPRRPRRVQVQFWKRGEPQASPGYTTNISLTGMFVATRSPLPPGTRLRIEVLEGERGFMVEGVVAHARKIHGELVRLSQPGMGVRFLSVEDLVRELIPGGHGDPEVPPPHQPSAPTPATKEGVFAVHFHSPGEFLEIYRRDIVNGGLFVSTRHPGRLQETVDVELHPPFPWARPVLVRARVVQRFEPTSDGFGDPNLLAGMGVELLDPASVVEKLRPFVERT
jgi:PilZ domain-containing protein